MNDEVYFCTRRKCRHMHTHDQQAQVPVKDGWTEGRCPACGSATFYLIDWKEMKLLFALGEVIEEGSENAGTGEFDFHPTSPLLKLEGLDAEKIERHLKRLKRFGLVGARREKGEAWYWITAKGHAARLLVKPPANSPFPPLPPVQS